MSTRTCYWFLFSMDNLYHASISNAIECFAIAVILWDAHPNLLLFFRNGITDFSYTIMA